MNSLTLDMLLAALLAIPASMAGAAPLAETDAAPTQADRMLADYFREQTQNLASNCLSEIRTLEDWKAHCELYRQRLFEMLSLSPLPSRTDLKATVTGRVEHDSFSVEKLHFQSSPGLYVSANLYLPKNSARPAPAILYVCGHGPVITNGISYGNKVVYQHHGGWFARHGYVCLIIDTLQLGEIQGLHHGTHREGMWWWNARGYTPAGVEAWNSIRSLDYLCTRPEVDTNRLGVTGRSGGGAYSWWLAALDERVKVAAPVAGITDLRNHVVDGAVEGHCDCMFTVNTYRWDYPQLAALVAPRPLLIVNTDDDRIFPLDGVQRTFAKLRPIYELHKARSQLGLVIGPGPHKDTQDLQVPVFRWFNKHLKGEDPPIEVAATKFFAPTQLKVFDQLPADQINTTIQESFVAPAPSPAPPKSAEEWKQQRSAWVAALQKKVFAAWPEGSALELKPKFAAERDGVNLAAYDFMSQDHVLLRLYLLQRKNLTKPERVVLNVLGPSSQPSESSEELFGFPQWVAMLQTAFHPELAEELAVTKTLTNNTAGFVVRESFARLKSLLAQSNLAMAYCAPRGIGLNAWSGDERKQIHIRRRFMLLGQTLDGMRVWDLRRAVQAVRSLEPLRNIPLSLRAEDRLACDALYAALFEPAVAQLDLWDLPASHREGPDYLNVLRFLEIPQAVAMAAERASVRVHGDAAEHWGFVTATARQAGWPQGRFTFERIERAAGE